MESAWGHGGFGAAWCEDLKRRLQKLKPGELFLAPGGWRHNKGAGCRKWGDDHHVTTHFGKGNLARSWNCRFMSGCSCRHGNKRLDTSVRETCPVRVKKHAASAHLTTPSSSLEPVGPFHQWPLKLPESPWRWPCDHLPVSAHQRFRATWRHLISLQNMQWRFLGEVLEPGWISWFHFFWVFARLNSYLCSCPLSCSSSDIIALRQSWRFVLFGLNAEPSI